MNNRLKYFYLAFIITLFTNYIKGQTDLHVTEQLLNGSIKIQAVSAQNISSGTGFYFTFNFKNKGDLPVIITNKHVVKGSSKINLFFKKQVNGKPDYGSPYKVTIPNDNIHVLNHPNKNIDLVAIPFNFILTELDKKSISLYYKTMNEERIPDDITQKKEFKSIEDILMIGYPNGLWDKSNNLPIVRKGITATTPYLDYNGKREFLVDIAAFGGSSGSPIYFYQDIYTDKKTYRAKVGIKLYLLGVLYAGPIYTVEGKVVKTNPNDSSRKVKTGIPMNLGYVIKASEILEF